MYSLLKSLHVACAASSIGLFVWRWRLGRLAAAPRSRWLRALPHVNDSLLLGAALAMLLLSGQDPRQVPWLSAKILGLLAYVALGVLAMRARQPALRLGAGLAALVSVGYIVSVALSKSPRGFLAAVF